MSRPDPFPDGNFENFDFADWMHDDNELPQNDALAPGPFDNHMAIDPQLLNGPAPAPNFDFNMNPVTFARDNALNGPNMGAVPFTNAPPGPPMSPLDFTMSNDAEQMAPFNLRSNGMNAGGPTVDPQRLTAGNTAGPGVDYMGSQILQILPYPASGVTSQGNHPAQRAQQPTLSAPGLYPQHGQQNFGVPYAFGWNGQGRIAPDLPTAPVQTNSRAPVQAPPTQTTAEDQPTHSTPPSGGRPILPKSTVHFVDDDDDDDDDDDEDSEPDSPLVTRKQPAKAKKKNTRERKSVSKAKQEAVKFPITTDQLLISSLAEANRVAIKRIPLEVVDDDRDEVAANPDVWISRITKAFEHDYREKCEDDDRLTKEGRDEFSRWQREHFNKTWAILTEHKDDVFRFLQSCAYIFYDLVLENHEPGNGLHHVSKTISNGGADIHLKCSQRLKGAIKALKQYTIVKYDFLMQARLDGLAASPQGFVHRKVENMFVNYKKKRGSGPVRKEEAVSSSKAQVMMSPPQTPIKTEM